MTVSTLNKKKVAFDAEQIRADFPILKQMPYGKPLMYFDNAATSQKPQSVIDALSKYYSTTNAYIHRGVHFLSQKASKEFDDVRMKVQNFINFVLENKVFYSVDYLLQQTEKEMSMATGASQRRRLNLRLAQSAAVQLRQDVHERVCSWFHCLAGHLLHGLVPRIGTKSVRTKVCSVSCWKRSLVSCWKRSLANGHERAALPSTVTSPDSRVTALAMSLSRISFSNSALMGRPMRFGTRGFRHYATTERVRCS